MITAQRKALALEKMSGDSRIWIYQASRLLTHEEIEGVSDEITDFLLGWQAHGSDLMAGSEVFNGLFLVIALDESFSAASGCSIDSCVRKIQEIGLRYNVDFMDRMKVAFQNGNMTDLIPVKDLSASIESGLITGKALVFDNSIQTLSQLDQWLKPAEETWLKRYFK